MIPIKDTLPSRSFPLINTLIIVLCGVAFLFELSLGPRLGEFIDAWGMIPLRIIASEDPLRLLTVASSMFLHGGWMHVIGNMWFLYIFGDNVEDALGKSRYILFYFLCGIAAAAAQILVDPTSKTPMVGASGAIAGVLGAYLVLFPRARVLTLVPIFIFLQLLELPAIVFIVLWFIMQAFQGFLSLGQSSGGGVAWWAHIGGFLVGLLLARPMLPSKGGLPRASPPAGPRRRIEW